MVASFYVCQPSHIPHSYLHFMFSDLTSANVITDVLHCVWSTGQSYPTKGIPTVLFLGLWPHSFHKIMYLYSICLVSTTCCDATITKHECNTNIQEIRTLLNTLLLLGVRGLGHPRTFNGNPGHPSLSELWLVSLAPTLSL